MNLRRPLSPHQEPSAKAGRGSGKLRALAIAVAGAAGAALAWQGGAYGVAGVGLALAAIVIFRRPEQANTVAASTMPSPTTKSAETPSSAKTQAQVGAAVMVRDIVPVWSRQLESTRAACDTGLAELLNAFSEMNNSADTLLANLDGMSGSLQAGAVDQAIVDSNPALEALSVPSERAFALRAAAVEELDHCAKTLTELDHLAKQTLEIGRHTRLVAFNASIEASRSDSTDGGNGAVAREMRLLAARMTDCGTAVHRLVVAQQSRLNAVLNTSVAEHTTPEELRMEVDLRAREALKILLGSVGDSLSASGSVRESSAQLRKILDEAFVHFQFGDRVSQRMDILGKDMNSFVDWIARHPGATREDAIAWLSRLEASYTMDEQRAEHHGNTHIDRGSEVEFF